MIRKGDDWGLRAIVPSDAVSCGDDAAVASLVAEAHREQSGLPPVVLTGGDLHRTLGGRAGRPTRSGGEGTLVKCDIGEALLDGSLRWFVAHMTIGGPWLIRPMTIVANAAHLGRWNIAPRAHPGDGTLDIVEAALSARQRVLALRRLPSGSHVPHPDITTSRAKHRQFELGGRGDPVRLDGTDAGPHRHVSVRVVEAHLSVYVV